MLWELTFKVERIRLGAGFEFHNICGIIQKLLLQLRTVYIDRQVVFIIRLQGNNASYNIYRKKTNKTKTNKKLLQWLRLLAMNVISSLFLSACSTHPWTLKGLY